ncbi:DNA translocase FtsK [Nitratireductor aestuarii]|uniref:DNA translocase FtsK n=1 Tax=Nitratireductor aestuarii TaxID=1735103 RepID=A0A916RKQ9_9HYPH|nr:DNA translocase FtsK [Nitratireductor aestuarii]GGA60969.1 DNA translocase FtsK [Nitratireductor aestuarii]
MSSGSSAAFAMHGSNFGVQNFLRRQTSRAHGLALLALVTFCIASLATWNVTDPSFSYATSNPVKNMMGFAGAAYADIAMQFFGLAAVASLVPAVIWGILLIAAYRIDRIPLRIISWFAGSVIAAGIAGCMTPPATWPLPTGLGGVFGDFLLSVPAYFTGGYPQGVLGIVVAALLFAPGLWLMFFGAGLIGRRPVAAVADEDVQEAFSDFEDEDLDEEDDRIGKGAVIVGFVTHWWLSARAFVRRKLPHVADDEDDFEDDFPVVSRRDDRRLEPGEFEDRRIEPRAVSERRIEPGFHDFDNDDIDEDLDDIVMQPVERSAPSRKGSTSAASGRVEEPVRTQPARVQREATRAAHDGSFELPPLNLLAEPKAAGKDPSLSKDVLEQNARRLEGVLEDFGVKGEILQVRPGPVVTLYELEPAPGIKSSRVIGLADDIARSMSAIAARVAVVPGRNAIGIELPNSRRETVYLRELMASNDFKTSKHRLALSLGKTINGEPVIADLAKMPHLLVAGTTGSGKSVAINTMILSLLYRLRPEECRLIMIDPKMLELSIYDGIPHLLTPVVTDPKKAVVALKWTVREMEDRYRKMSKVGVRNIEGFNQRVAAAKKKGEVIQRTVQTGFDRETGEAIYETEELDLEPMPFIVVIIDEMADLMMVAGKDIEGAVQRLAQMARAAGIHVIMATQRPSVDVITGTIKANFPTRISFQVTSKIDSRTILGEQGAEQLLGMGDMLYMAGGGRTQRVHGPFVADQEVEQIVQHLKMQGAPDYLEAVTEDDDEEGGESSSGGPAGTGNLAESDDPYDQAVAIVLRDGKASTSYIQRRLGIGYNRAASIIERMEQEGVISPANHAGKREILVPTERDEM